jgi:tRNA pseudouridine38-40 synthase
MNIACGIEYDGTNYHGFQRQPEHHGPTVQGVLEGAIERIGGVFAVVNAAGRTDAGVHASGQVIHFRTNARLTPEIWQRALNAVLPTTIAVRWARDVPERFHARFSALSRAYRYTIWNDLAPTALRARYSYHYPHELDVDLMQEACHSLLGTRDFGAFGHSPEVKRLVPVQPLWTGGPNALDSSANPKGHTVASGSHHCIRTMLEACCVRDDAQRELIYCDFMANAFLTGQVRRMVGTLLLVGQKRLSLEEFAVIVQRAEKGHPGSAAPPHGLCLVQVRYPETFGVMNDDKDI